MKIKLKIKNWKRVFNGQIYSILFNYDTPTEVFYGGASSGKSQGVYQKIVIKACKEWSTPRRMLIVRKVSNSIKDSSWQHVKDVLTEFKLYSKCKLNKSDMTVELPNGAILLFKGLDDPEKIKSIKGISDIVMEEASEFTEEDYEQLKLRLRDKSHKKRQMFLMFNPISKKNWAFKTFFDEATEKPKDFENVRIFHSTYKDNRFLDDEVRRDLEELANRSPVYYRIYTLGLFATLDKLIFPKYQYRLISDKEVSGLPQLNGLDFGYTNDPSALVTLRYDEIKKIIYITGEYVKNGLLNNKIAQAIINLGLSKEEIWADSQEPKSIDEIKSYGVSRIRGVVKYPNSVIQGLQWIQQHTIIIDERCPKVKEEADNYTWKKDKRTGEYKNEPVDGYNHTWDAIRYALSKFIKASGKIKVVSYQGLGI